MNWHIQYVTHAVEANNLGEWRKKQKNVSFSLNFNTVERGAPLARCRQFFVFQIPLRPRGK